eukprot:3989448-Pleurochrysis_carterae.AAC.1
MTSLASWHRMSVRSRRRGSAHSLLPAAVVVVIGDFRSLCRGPSGAVVTQGLLACFGVALTGRAQGSRGVAHGEECRGVSIAKRIRTETALEVLMECWFIGRSRLDIVGVGVLRQGSVGHLGRSPAVVRGLMVCSGERVGA